MKVETVNTQRPDVVITLTADEADKLYAILSSVSGGGSVGDFAYHLWDKLVPLSKQTYYDKIMNVMETK